MAPRVALADPRADDGPECVLARAYGATAKPTAESRPDTRKQGRGGSAAEPMAPRVALADPRADDGPECVSARAYGATAKPTAESRPDTRKQGRGGSAAEPMAPRVALADPRADDGPECVSARAYGATDTRKQGRGGSAAEPMAPRVALADPRADDGPECVSARAYGATDTRKQGRGGSAAEPMAPRVALADPRADDGPECVSARAYGATEGVRSARVRRFLHCCWGRRISSRGRGPQGPRAERRRKPLTSAPQDPGTEAEERGSAEPGRHARSRLWAHRAHSSGRIRPNAPTHTGRHTQTGRKRERHTESEGQREKREWERRRYTQSHGSSGTETQPPQAHSPPDAAGFCSGPEGHSGERAAHGQAGGMVVEITGARLLGRLTPTPSGQADAGTRRLFPRTPPAVLSSWPAPCDSRRPSGDVPEGVRSARVTRFLHCCWGRRISSRGAHRNTQAQRQKKEARQSQADTQEVAFGRTGRIRPNAPTHTGRHTQTGRKRERHTESEGQRDKREWERRRHTQSHGSSGTETQPPQAHSPPRRCRLLLRA
ncbi:uncharacterized protein [Chlorocebus sabaeus]|uniref:uncharacterized protein n=1 Tax=Chlorocebus sabaeus TaxID=60711 RepID=UPI003BF9F9BC